MPPGTVTHLVARELRADLARRRMTAAELARRAGMNPSVVARIVRGAQAITIDHYAAIVAALNSTSYEDVGRSLVIEMHAHAMRGAVDIATHAAHDARQQETDGVPSAASLDTIEVDG
jgi:transcriptional regulator with XRE-family HTH domain